jgi:hypothetical protein
MRIQGVITLVRSDRSFFMQDHEAGLSVNLAKPLTSVNVGDQIEAVGFPSAGTNSPVLEDSIVRIGRSQFPATPTKIGSDEALRGDWDAKLIEIEGKLVSRLRRTGQQFLTLQAGPRTFTIALWRGVQKYSKSTAKVQQILGTTSRPAKKKACTISCLD